MLSIFGVIKRIAFYALIQEWFCYILVLGFKQNIHLVFFSYGIQKITLYLIFIWLFYLIKIRTLVISFSILFF
jgi:hypothetical protein